jgi:hypothetical protein
MTDRMLSRLPGEPGDEDRFEIDPRFERGIDAARQSLREGRGVKLEDIDAEK